MSFAGYHPTPRKENLIPSFVVSRNMGREKVAHLEVGQVLHPFACQKVLVQEGRYLADRKYQSSGYHAAHFSLNKLPGIQATFPYVLRQRGRPATWP